MYQDKNWAWVYSSTGFWFAYVGQHVAILLSRAATMAESDSSTGRGLAGMYGG